MKNRIELAKYFGKLGFKRGAEVGVFDGRYSEILCQNIPGLKLLCVDTWPKERVYKIAQEKLAKYDTKLVRKPSMEAVKDIPDESLDFVFIDADHKYDAVKEDVREWAKKVRKGGIVSGHDYYVFHFSHNRGVIDAVDEYVKDNGLELFTTDQDWNASAKDDRQPSWYFFKKPAVSTIIFSKNRACQLELLLRNLNMPSTVIYTFDPEFEAGYEKLIKMYPSVRFIRQTNLKEQVLENLGEYTMFDVDDDVMLEHFDENCPEFTEFKNNPDILCLSLRLSPLLTRRTPHFGSNNTWEWHGQKHSWGYPMALTATIFRKEDIENTIKESEFEIPNDLEVALRKNPPDRPLMMCFDRPKTVTNEANRVQNKYPTPNLGVSLKMLEEKFLAGERLSLDYIKEAAAGASDCFIRVDYKWEKAK